MRADNIARIPPASRRVDISCSQRHSTGEVGRSSRESDETWPSQNCRRYANTASGATTFSKLRGPIPWSMVLLPFYRKQ